MTSSPSGPMDACPYSLGIAEAQDVRAPMAAGPVAEPSKIGQSGTVVGAGAPGP